jgi:hypothetical protein
VVFKIARASLFNSNLVHGTVVKDIRETLPEDAMSTKGIGQAFSGGLEYKQPKLVPESFF